MKETTFVLKVQSNNFLNESSDPIKKAIREIEKQQSTVTVLKTFHGTTAEKLDL